MLTIQEKLTAGASLTAVTVLSATWLLRDTIIAAISSTVRTKRRLQLLPSSVREQLRLWTLKMRGLEDYVGRHRDGWTYAATA